MAGGEIYLEILNVGQALEVVAIDANTRTEVRFAAPASASEEQIKMLARSKINYVLTRGEKDKKKIPPRDNRGGIIV